MSGEYYRSESMTWPAAGTGAAEAHSGTGAALPETEEKERPKASVVLAYVVAALSIFASVVPPVGVTLAIIGMVMGRQHRFRQESDRWLTGARGMALAAILFSLVLTLIYVVLAADYIADRRLNIR